MITAVLVGVLAAGAQLPPPPPPRPMAPMQGQPRDPGRRVAPEPAGTGAIRGRVIAADTGRPVRRANVTLVMLAPPATTGTGATGAGAAATPMGQTITSNTGQTLAIGGAGMMRPKSVTTDAQGGFGFSDLPAGSYRLTASPGQYSGAYLSIAYGATKPGAPGAPDFGTAIQLGDGQVFDKATVALPRGAAIVGRVVDDNGEPIARVQVYTLMYPPGSTRGNRAGGGASTDDLGQFRIFGLPPGEYAVAAEARGNTFVPPNAPPETEEDKIGFLTTYFPAATDEAEAQHVRTRAGAETPGVEIHLAMGRLFHLAGTVTDSQGRAAARMSGMLVKRTTQSGGALGTFGFSTDEQGRFQMRSIAPGSYRLIVRPQPSGPRNPDGGPVDPGESASLPLAINADVDDLLVTTSPGATITGTVVFENGPPQLQAGQQSFQMRVSTTAAEPEQMIGGLMPQAIVTPDLTFTMKGLMGDIVLRSNAPDNILKSVQLGGDDITDTPHEFKNGDRVTLVMTSRGSSVEGTISDAAGKPVTDAAVMLFSDDKAKWRIFSLRTRRGTADPTGHFRLPGVLPGTYYLIALPRERANGLQLANDPSVFEALAKEATSVVVGEEEQRQVDVKLSGG